MLFCGITMHVAIGTGAAIGVPIAVVGTIGYILSGSQIDGLPPHSIGFVYLPALISLVVASVLTAPFGARAAHRLPVQTLKRVFACLLYVLAIKMVMSYW
ncbi:MAG: sulfite exporter TauE/SafE family protein, partial [Lautropia sp.]